MKKRRYGQWKRHPEGWGEDVTRCIASVQGVDDPHRRQCAKLRGHGPDGDYCNVHAKRLADGKDVKVPEGK